MSDFVNPIDVDALVQEPIPGSKREFAEKLRAINNSSDNIDDDVDAWYDHVNSWAEDQNDFMNATPTKNIVPHNNCTFPDTAFAINQIEEAYLRQLEDKYLAKDDIFPQDERKFSREQKISAIVDRLPLDGRFPSQAPRFTARSVITVDSRSVIRVADQNVLEADDLSVIEVEDENAIQYDDQDVIEVDDQSIVQFEDQNAIGYGDGNVIMADDQSEIHSIRNEFAASPVYNQTPPDFSPTTPKTQSPALTTDYPDFGPEIQTRSAEGYLLYTLREEKDLEAPSNRIYGALTPEPQTPPSPTNTDITMEADNEILGEERFVTAPPHLYLTSDGMDPFWHQQSVNQPNRLPNPFSDSWFGMPTTIEYDNTFDFRELGPLPAPPQTWHGMDLSNPVYYENAGKIFGDFGEHLKYNTPYETPHGPGLASYVEAKNQATDVHLGREIFNIPQYYD